MLGILSSNCYRFTAKTKGNIIKSKILLFCVRVCAFGLFILSEEGICSSHQVLKKVLDPNISSEPLC